MKTLALFALVSALTLAAPTPKPAVVLVCYPTDEATKTECSAVEEKMSRCGFAVTIFENEAPEAIAKKLKAGTFPAHVPVFLSGHGDNETVAGQRRHFIVASEQRKIDTRELKLALEGALDKPSVWASTCRSGTACDSTTPCFGAACLGFQYAAGPVGGIEHTMDDLTTLLCHPEDPRWGKDGVLDSGELNAFFCEKYGEFGGVSIVVGPAEVEETRMRLTGQPGVKEIKEEEFSVGYRGSARVPRVRITATVDKCAAIAYVDRAIRRTQSPFVHTFELYAPVTRPKPDTAPPRLPLAEREAPRIPIEKRH